MLIKILSLILFINCVQFSKSFNLNLFQSCIQESGVPFNSVVSQSSNTTLYNYLNHQWNIRVQTIHPMAYFLPRTTTDVEVAVRCGTKINIPVIPKGGAHSHESYSFGNSTTIIIDFLQMKNIQVDAIEKTTTIEAGALLGEVGLQLWRSGGFAIPTGLCLNVGISGFTLGGGNGYLSPTHGLAIDNLIELEMVAADGSVHIVNESSNSDLFWALRGVGSGFIGIVTKFKFKVFDASKLKKITHVTYWFDINQSTQIMEGWQNWMTWTTQNDPTVMSGLHFGPIKNSTREIGIKMRAYHFQEEGGNDSSAFLKAFDEIFPNPAENSTIYYNSYWEFILTTSTLPSVGTNITESDLENIRNELYPARYLKRKSFFVSKIFGSNDLQKVGQVLERVPASSLIVVWLWFEGGAVSQVAPNETAYVHRDSLYSIVADFYYSPPVQPTAPEVEEGLGWLSQFMEASHFMDNLGTYQNYVDGDRSDYLQRYYGRNLNRLVETKRSWDPNNYFRNPASLPV